jgi:NAD-dependent DNA ligase
LNAATQHEQIEALTQNRDQLQRQLQDTSTEVITIQKHRQQLEQENTDLAHASQQFNTQMIELEEQLNGVMQERDRSQQELQTATETIAQLQIQIRNLEQQPVTLKNQINTLVQERDALTQELQQSQQAVTSLQQQTQTWSNEKATLEEAMQLAKDVIGSLEGQISHLMQDQLQLEVALQQAQISPSSPVQSSSTPAANLQIERDRSQSKISTNEVEVETQPQLPPAVAEKSAEPTAHQAKPIHPFPTTSSPALPEQPANSKQPFAKKSVVITGKLSVLSAEKAQALIQEAGGQVHSIPSSKTSYIVVGQDPGNKLKKAQKYKVPELTEAQLLELLGVDATEV